MLKVLVFCILWSVSKSDILQDPKCVTQGVPVCGRSENEIVLFVNECMMERSNMEMRPGQSKFKKTKLSYCMPDCELQCPVVAKPVCALHPLTKAKETFFNHCEMSRRSCFDGEDWEIAYYESCKQEKRKSRRRKTSLKSRRIKKKKPVGCKDVMNPVCASFAGVKSTFKNECLVNAENVRTGKTWVIFSQGICEEDYANLKYPKLKEKKSLTNEHLLSLLEEQKENDKSLPLHTDFKDSFEVKNLRNHLSVPFVEDVDFDYILKDLPLVEVSNLASSHKCQFGDNPVCGSYRGHTKTFQTVCALIMENLNSRYTWSILQEGPCQDCNFNCPYTYKPICVQRNGYNVTILNECQLKTMTCNDRISEFRFVKQGPCERYTKSLDYEKPRSWKPRNSFAKKPLEQRQQRKEHADQSGAKHRFKYNLKKERKIVKVSKEMDTQKPFLERKFESPRLSSNKIVESPKPKSEEEQIHLVIKTNPPSSTTSLPIALTKSNISGVSNSSLEDKSSLTIEDSRESEEEIEFRFIKSSKDLLERVTRLPVSLEKESPDNRPSEILNRIADIESFLGSLQRNFNQTSLNSSSIPSSFASKKTIEVDESKENDLNTSGFFTGTLQNEDSREEIGSGFTISNHNDVPNVPLTRGFPVASGSEEDAAIPQETSTTTFLMPDTFTTFMPDLNESSLEPGKAIVGHNQTILNEPEFEATTLPDLMKPNSLSLNKPLSSEVVIELRKAADLQSSLDKSQSSEEVIESQKAADLQNSLDESDTSEGDVDPQKAVDLQSSQDKSDTSEGDIEPQKAANLQNSQDKSDTSEGVIEPQKFANLQNDLNKSDSTEGVVDPQKALDLQNSLDKSDTPEGDIEPKNSINLQNDFNKSDSTEVIFELRKATDLQRSNAIDTDLEKTSDKNNLHKSSNLKPPSINDFESKKELNINQAQTLKETVDNSSLLKSNEAPKLIDNSNNSSLEKETQSQTPTNASPEPALSLSKSSQSNDMKENHNLEANPIKDSSASVLTHFNKTNLTKSEALESTMAKSPVAESSPTNLDKDLHKPLVKVTLSSSPRELGHLETNLVQPALNNFHNQTPMTISKNSTSTSVSELTRLAPQVEESNLTKTLSDQTMTPTLDTHLTSSKPQNHSAQPFNNELSPIEFIVAAKPSVKAAQNDFASPTSDASLLDTTSPLPIVITTNSLESHDSNIASDFSQSNSVISSFLRKEALVDDDLRPMKISGRLSIYGPQIDSVMMQMALRKDALLKKHGLLK